MVKPELCECDDWDCILPHTAKELIELVEPEDEETSKCPKCNSEAYVYDYNGLPLGWCGVCEAEFDVATGEIMPDESIVLKHEVVMDEQQVYYCKACKFESLFMEEANKHERENNSTEKEQPHYVSIRKVNGNIVQGEWECIYCHKVFTGQFQEALAHENPLGRSLNQSNSSGSTGVVYKHCSHPPRHVIDFIGDTCECGGIITREDGEPVCSKGCKVKDCGVWAGRKYDCEDKADEFDLIFNLSGTSIIKKQSHEIPVPELSKWENYSPKSHNFTEILLDWPDGGVVQLPKEFWRDLIKYIKKEKLKVLVFCIGGHGRTGTAIGSMLITAFKWEPETACNWVWDDKHYCHEAIETNAQVSYVYWIGGKTYTPPPSTQQKIVTYSQQGQTLWD